MSFDYKRYLASREWAERKEALRKRSGGVCERCHVRPYESTHHLTYANVGNEPLEDLLACCNPCHEYLSAKRSTDPKCDVMIALVAVPYELMRQGSEWAFAICRGGMTLVAYIDEDGNTCFAKERYREAVWDVHEKVVHKTQSQTAGHSAGLV